MKKLIFLLFLSAFTKSMAHPDSLTFAVLGNSISTYYDYIPSGYSVYYSQDREKSYGIQVGDTWWMQLSRLSGLTFLANASWSGSRVAADALNSNSPFLSNHRVNALGRAGDPDFIFIAGGTNDWYAAQVPLGSYRTENFTDSLSFRGAYQRLLYKLTTWYPQSRIVCLSIFPRGNGVNDKNSQGWSQADANASIRYIAKQFGQYYVDCTTVPWSNNWSATTLDKLHPTTFGSTQLADHIYDALISQRIITRGLKRSDEVDEAERLLDLSFTEEGIVNNGTYDAKVGKRGTATTLYDAANNVYLGCTKAKSSDFFYATYDEETSLANAFNSNVTWEMLVRLDAMADASGNIGRTCILGNEEGNGGWAFYNSALASTFSYCHESGVKSTMKSITGDSILVAGKFYHLVVTMDRMSHIMRYYLNGKLVCTGTRAGTDMPFPLCGTIKGRRDMWICLGGDATSGSFGGSAENSSACSFVFARIYDGALSQRAALKLYNAEVKAFTEPQSVCGKELFLDCEFTSDGAINRASGFQQRSVQMVGEVPMNYNADYNLYEAQFNKVRTHLFKYNIGDSPLIMSQLSDAYSVEVFCRSSSAKPTASIRPLSFPNGYGTGLQMSAKGNIGYTTTTQGNKADGTFTKTQWSWLEDGCLTTDYTHYVIVFDRMNYTSQLYVNGELANTRWLTFKECPVYEWAPSSWFAIGGDAKGNYETATQTGSYPYMGDVAMVRLYGRALNASQVSELVGIIGKQEVSYTLGSNGYAAVCLPYVWQVPEGYSAYIVSETTSQSVVLNAIARAGDYVPYGTPVFVKGAPKSTITLKAMKKNEVKAEYLTAQWPQNLLSGVYPGKILTVGDGFYFRSTGAHLYRVTGNVELPPFSCYLPSAERRAYFTIEEAEDADGIASPQSTCEREISDAIYGLDGRKVEKTDVKHGVYIHRRKKILR